MKATAPLFVLYLRVSTKRQGTSGLGLEGQREAVAKYLRENNGELLASYEVVESGKNDERPQLKRALERAKQAGAKLIVAKLDRLGRKAWFMLKLINESGVDFHFCDYPSADKLVIGMMSLLAEKEADMISERTKAALAAKKAQGYKLGNPKIATARERAYKVLRQNKLQRLGSATNIMRDIVLVGKVSSHSGIAKAMNARGIPTARGKKWHVTSVRRMIPMPVKQWAESLKVTN